MKAHAEHKVAVGKRWMCPTCDKAVSTAFCPSCGECPPRPHDLTLRGFAGQVTVAVTSMDGSFPRSLRDLVTSPGALTVSYLKGRRKAWTPPLQLFLILNVLFFAMQSITGSKIFSTPLEQHLHSDIWGGVAQQLVARHLEARQITLAGYAPVFDQAVALNAKSLIVLMVLPFALAPGLAFYRSRRPFVAHLVFSLHFYSFLLVVMCVSLTVVGASLLLGGPGLESDSFDHALSIMELAVSAVYLYVAAGAVYDATGTSRVFKVFLLVVAAAGVFLGYRFVLLLITLAGT